MSASLESNADLSTRDRLKRAAQLLFGRFGIDGVSVQQIVSAAGQRNNASLHYHFGSKEELVRLLVVEGAQHLDTRRWEMLTALSKEQGAENVRQVLEVLVRPVVQLSDSERWFGYIRFIANLQLWNRELLRSALNNQWNSAYIACLGHLQRMMEEDQPSRIIEQKLSFLGIYSNAILTAREAAMERHQAEPHRFWAGVHTVENIMDTLEAMLVAPPSKATISQLSLSSN